jgi:hypothetical protein
VSTIIILSIILSAIAIVVNLAILISEFLRISWINKKYGPWGGKEEYNEWMNKFK